MTSYNRYPRGLRVTACVYALVAALVALIFPLVFKAVFPDDAVGVPWTRVVQAVWLAVLIALATPNAKLLCLPALFGACDAVEGLVFTIRELRRVREIDPNVVIGVDPSAWVWHGAAIAAYVIVTVAIIFALFGSRGMRTAAFIATVAATAIFALPTFCEAIRWGFERGGAVMFTQRMFDVIFLAAHVWVAAMLRKERSDTTQTEVQ